MDLGLVEKLHRSLQMAGQAGHDVRAGLPAPTENGGRLAPTPARYANGSGALFGGSRQRCDGDMHAVIRPALELHLAVDQREDRVVAAEADIGARLPLGAALAEDDVAGDTASPPNFLMPRRRPAVSRPLREEPPAFLCAMRAYSLARLGRQAPGAAASAPSASAASRPSGGQAAGVARPWSYSWCSGSRRRQRQRRSDQPRRPPVRGPHGSARRQPAAAAAPSAPGRPCSKPAMRSTVTCWRWPLRRRLFCRRRFLKMMILSSRSCAITVAVTEAPATVGAPSVTPASLPTREHVGEGDGRAGLRLQLLDLQHRIRRHPVLFPAGADHCEHRADSQTIAGRQETRRPESGVIAGGRGVNVGDRIVQRE